MDKFSCPLKEKMETCVAQEGKGYCLDLGSAERELLESQSESLVVQTSAYSEPLNLTSRK